MAADLDLAAAPGSMSWIPAATADGSWTLVHGELGEGCHSRSGAWQQARERYAEGCRLGERARGRSELWLLDVGTGLGLNLAAALEALATEDVSLCAVSLERDPAVLCAGCELYERPELRAGPWERWHAPVRAALRSAIAALSSSQSPRSIEVPLGKNSTLRLHLGDARQTIALQPSRRFDAVFLDPFSPRRDPALWEPEFLAELARTMAPGSWLSTYSAAFRVRLGLAQAGLRVGCGPRVGAKGEGTLASPDQDLPGLPSRLARRLKRRLETR